MGKWLIHHFPNLAKLRPILRAIEIIDMVIGFYERLPKSFKWIVKVIGMLIVTRLAQIWLAIWSWVEPNWRGFLSVLVAGLIIVTLFCLIHRRRNRPLSPTESTANNQERLNLEIRGRIGGSGRIFDTPEGDNPLWILQDPLYAGGLFWNPNLLFVNKEQQPVNITATLAIPIEKENPSKRFRVTALNKPIYKHRDERILYSRPEHLAFPVYIDSCRAVNGHAEFAIEGFQYNALGDSFTQIVGGHNHILEVEDLLSGKKAEFNL